jgi:hypothetical protein
MSIEEYQVDQTAGPQSHRYPQEEGQWGLADSTEGYSLYAAIAALRIIFPIKSNTGFFLLKASLTWYMESMT